MYSCGNQNPGQVLTVTDSAQLIPPDEDTSSPAGITFHISNVKRAESALPVEDMRYAIETRIGKKVFAWPHEQDSLPVVPSNMNGFVETVQYCFDEHRPLAISPDAIWLLICQGFSIHLNENFDSLQYAVFTGDKPVDIIVRNDSLSKGKTADWQMLISGLSEQTKSYTKSDVYGTVVQHFSTTTPIERTAFEITLLESQKKAFNYIAESGCGIPEITLKGKISDWQQILDSVENFRRFGLDEWVDNLQPVLRQFVYARKGDIDTAFWNSLYKYSASYGSVSVSGWFLKFFPYVKEYYNEGEFQKFRYVKNKFLNENDFCFSDLTTENFPSGFAKIDLQWNDFGQHKEMEICSGFFGIRQHEKTKTLEPVISWAVFEKNAKPVEHEYKSSRQEIAHLPDRWIPSIETEVKTLPLYGSCKTYEESRAKLTRHLQDTLILLGKEKGFTPEDITIDFVVTWNGTMTQVEQIRKAQPYSSFRTEIRHCLVFLPESWKPATQMIDFDGPEPEPTRVNYRVSLKLDF